jgi:uracil-DNA glycosylase
VSRVLICGEAWGREEAAARSPFVGASGRELNRLLEESGFLPPGTSYTLNRDLWRGLHNRRDELFAAAGIYLTNVFNLQPAGNKIETLCQKERVEGLPAIRPANYIRREFYTEFERLRVEIQRERPNLIIALGATATWFTLRSTTITKLRGAVAASDYGKVLPTFHPAYLMRGAWNLRPIVVFDLIKARREAEYPEIRRPERYVYIPESVDEITSMLNEIVGASVLSIDIETVADQITCIGFAWSTQHCLVIPIFDHRRASKSYWSADEEPQVWRLIKELCQSTPPKIFQNGLYDIHFLWRRYGITPTNCEHDTMLLHHALQPEVQKGLGFLGSVYTNEISWKLMRKGASRTVKDIREE